MRFSLFSKLLTSNLNVDPLPKSTILAPTSKFSVNFLDTSKLEKATCKLKGVFNELSQDDKSKTNVSTGSFINSHNQSQVGIFSNIKIINIVIK